MRTSAAAPSLVVLAAFLWPCGGTAEARDLSFEERVRAQEAIERVYHSHRIGATRPFEVAVPPRVLAAKVRTYLGQTVALETLWRTRVTAAMLRKEMERMTRETRLPERLRGLYAALGHDAFLIQECLARPALVDRLARSFFAYDQRLHAESSRRAESLRRDLAAGRIDPYAGYPGRHVVTLVPASASGGGGGTVPGAPRPAPALGDSWRVELEAAEFENRLARLQREIGSPGPVSETSEAFLVRVVLSAGPDEAQIATYRSDKVSWDDWWGEVGPGLDANAVDAVASGEVALQVPEATSCAQDDTWEGIPGAFPQARARHTSVWTGNLMIVWGGVYAAAAGARYDPATDTWTPTSTVNAPSGRTGHVAVWTGREMIVWGGSSTNTGGRYDPETDTWSPTSTSGAPSARTDHTAVWSGSEMIVWGGYDSSGRVNTGGRYDPRTDTWSATTTTGAPEERSNHTAVWTGSRMLVWGGFSFSTTGGLRTGGEYDPQQDRWLGLIAANPPTGRYDHTSVWTGSAMIVWGGSSGGWAVQSGGVYEPGADSWRETSTANAPSARTGHTAVWTGSRMVVWGGGGARSDGGAYDPVADSWRPTSTLGAPSSRTRHTAVWTGALMIVWGGYDGLYLHTGGRYDPEADHWTPTGGHEPPARYLHTAVWTGSEMIVWGGWNNAGDVYFTYKNGARYDPATQRWSPMSTIGVPAGAIFHSAVWTGSEMIVWGGEALTFENTGGRYDPVADAWTPTSTTGAPSGRELHTAVWTGSEIIVWGGDAVGSPPATGGRYDPRLDLWVPTSTRDAPSGRYGHTAVWTGSRMVIWGGSDGTQRLNTGALYDPFTDTWTPTSSVGAPSARGFHTAVWTGRLMIVGGGNGYTNSGGRYDPELDSWQATSTSGAGVRFGHTATWTGREMIVWSGSSDTTGGRYDPEADSWRPTTTANAPAPRQYHAAVWTGDRMLVWGGFDGYGGLGDGGRYCACETVTYYPDRDGDGRGDPSSASQLCHMVTGYVTDGSDCDDADASVWAAPSEALDLVFADAWTLAWGAPAEPGATMVVYDLIRSGSPAGFLSSATCVASDEPRTTAADPEAPASGAAFYYVVRAESACPFGEGSLGTDPGGAPILGRSCP